MDRSKIVYLKNDTRHYYYLDLLSKNHGVGYYQSTTPKELKFDDMVFTQNSWKNLLIDVIGRLLDKFPGKELELRNYTPSWSGRRQVVSHKKETTTHNKIKDNLFMSWDTTTIHSVWTLIDVLTLFDIDLRNASLLVHRPSGAESKETIEYFSQEYLAFFKEHLGSKGFDSDKIDHIEKDVFPYLLLKYRRICPPNSAAYPDLFAMDSMYAVANYIQNRLTEEVTKDRFRCLNTHEFDERLECVDLIAEAYSLYFKSKKAAARAF